MGDELGDWAAAAARLEQVVGEILIDRRLSQKEMEAVQSIDSLAQHLAQLSVFCGDLAQGSGDIVQLPDEVIASSLSRLRPSGLSGRLSGSPLSVGLPAGEAELW
ncbi:hypothetical protein [Brevundimonas sp.]|jgi:hypothetical protein|uniref:hypothetical protein n=1 Tax=Brevundimonas sp. TaxID=1871086 RepID=UPI003782F015